MAASLSHIIEAWGSFTYDTTAFQTAARKYGEEENKRIFTDILTEIASKR